MSKIFDTTLRDGLLNPAYKLEVEMQHKKTTVKDIHNNFIELSDPIIAKHSQRFFKTGKEKYLKIHYKEMPRTMLRYSIEKFSEDKRKAYLNGKI